jgi:hypothetical protein
MTLRGCHHLRSELFRHDVSTIRGSPAPDSPRPTTASSECEHSEVCDDRVTMRPEGHRAIRRDAQLERQLRLPTPGLDRRCSHHAGRAHDSDVAADAAPRRPQRPRAACVTGLPVLRCLHRSADELRTSRATKDPTSDIETRRPPPSILSVGHGRRPLGVVGASASIGEGPSPRPRMLASQDSSSHRRPGVATGTRRSLRKADAQANERPPMT